ncbi:MAG: 6-pyruvoyl trahydropterin synthase family protein [Parvibaculales bacterium]
MQLTRDFNFDAAHALAHYGEGHANARLHGHSFRARITVEGMPDAHGQIVDFDKFGKILEQVRAELDHQMLNDIVGLEVPTLENLCLWLWARLAEELPQICAVEMFRDSLGQSCLYKGSQHGR